MAGLAYLAPITERPYNYMYEPSTGTAQQNCEYRVSPVWIKDARAMASPSIHVEGFELWDAPPAVTDFTDEDAIRKRYYAEAAELAKYVTGANHAHIFDHQVRQREAGRPTLTFGRRGDGSRPGAAGRIHNDYTESSGQKRFEAVRTASGQVVSVDGPINARAGVDAVTVAGPFVANIDRFFERTEVLNPLYAALRRQHERGALLASYCTGSFILAEAGLIDGGVATTHWAKAKTFAKRYPEVDLRVSEILTEQNNILCSAAVTTSLNLALRIVEKFAGRQVAMETGRMMLIDSNRVSQSSYALMQDEPRHPDALVARAQRIMERSLQQGFNLGELARNLGVSERTLHRRFKLAFGAAPLQHLQTLRVDVAKTTVADGGIDGGRRR
jgi:transcriptional regulator GlxA family with amidase domain